MRPEEGCCLPQADLTVHVGSVVCEAAPVRAVGQAAEDRPQLLLPHKQRRQCLWLHQGMTDARPYLAAAATAPVCYACCPLSGIDRHSQRPLPGLYRTCTDLDNCTSSRSECCENPRLRHTSRVVTMWQTVRTAFEMPCLPPAVA